MATRVLFAIVDKNATSLYSKIMASGTIIVSVTENKSNYGKCNYSKTEPKKRRLQSKA